MVGGFWDPCSEMTIYTCTYQKSKSSFEKFVREPENESQIKAIPNLKGKEMIVIKKVQKYERLCHLNVSLSSKAVVLNWGAAEPLESSWGAANLRTLRLYTGKL